MSFLRLAFALLIAAAASACSPARPRPDYMEPLRPKDRVERLDTLPAFLKAIRAELETGRVQDAWLAYEAEHARLFAAAHAVTDDPGNEKLIRLVASTEAILALVSALEAAAPSELDTLTQRLTTTFGQPPKVTVAFAVAIDPLPLFEGTWDDRPLLLVNARHPELADPPARQAALARALFGVLHRERFADSPSLGPLATRVYRDGAISFAARQLVPDALEAQVLGVAEERLSAARKRERLLAKELLAVIDSSSTIEAERFFDPSLRDPIVPRGGGALIADRLYQRLAVELGSATRPLQLAPTEFLARIRPHAAAIAAGR